MNQRGTFLTLLCAFAFALAGFVTEAGAQGTASDLVKRKFGESARPKILNVQKPVFSGSTSIMTYVTQDFESGVVPPAGWSRRNPDASYTWDTARVSSYGVGTWSAFMDFYDYSATGQFDSLLSPVITGLAASDSIIFDYAYTDYSSSFTNDSLIVAVSTDGGTTFTSLWREGGPNLRTAPSTTSFFIPTPSQWATKRLPVPAGVVGNNVVVAFIGRNNYGNNAYIDNIKIGSPSGGGLTGTKTIPGNYASIAAAIADLNTQGVGSGGVTFNVAAGYTETITAPLSITATGTASNPIIFQKSGSGANPLITAYTGGTGTPSTAVQDGIWNLVGSDYVTINGIDLRDNPANTTNPATMEYGYALYKASATDGCKYVTIRNCTITLNRVNNDAGSGPAVDGSRGIDVVNAIPTAATTALTITDSAGANSYNKFYSNTIQNCNVGIALIGFADVAPFTYADWNNDIGGTSAATGNTIKNFGGGGTTSPAAAVRTLAQYGVNVSYNTINNNDGAGVNHATTLRGIYLNTAVSASATVKNNTLTLISDGTTTTVSVIENVSGATAASNTIDISNNIIQNCTNDLRTTGAWYGIWNNAASAANLIINNNKFVGNTSKATSGATYLIYNSGAVASTISIAGDSLSFSFTGSAAYTGTMYNIYNGGGTTATTLTIANNNFSNYVYSTVTGTGSLYFIYNTASCANTTFNGNTWTNLSLNHSGSEYLIYNSSSTQVALTVTNNRIVGTWTRTAAAGTMYCYYAGSSSLGTSTQTFSNNNFSNITGTTAGTGTFYGFYNSDGATSPYPKKSVFNNTISNVTYPTTGVFYGFYTTYLGDGSTTSGSAVYNNTVSGVTTSGTIYSLYPGSTVSPTYKPEFYGNTVNNITTNGAASVAYGSYIFGGGAGLNFYKNKIYTITANGATGIAYGLYIGGATTTTIYNNLVGDIKAPNSSPASAPYLAVAGMYISAGTTVNAYYNTIYLNTTSVGTNFSSAAVYVSTTPTTVDLRDNIFSNLSTPVGAGFTMAFGRNGTALTNYAATSNNNLFYAGTPSATNLIFYDGTNSDQTLAAFKARVTPRDANSITENPPFVSTTGSDATFLHISTTTPTQIESGGAPIAGITDDFDGNTRNASTPDIGADEFTGIGIDLTPPTIVYTPLGYTSSTTARTLTATITDVSGVPTSGIGLPVLYWKKNSGSYSSATATSLGSNQYQFSFGGGVAIGDTVSYYIVAQDLVSPPNVGAQPSLGASGFTPNPPACSTPPTNPSFYYITNLPLSGNYTVGLTLFNRVAGRNLTFEKSVRKVMKEVVVEVPQNQNATPKGAPEEAAATTVGVQAPGITQLVEVEEVSWIPMENGQVFTGNLYVKKNENPGLQWPPDIDGIYPTITAAIADLNLRGTSGPTNFLFVDTAYTTETYPLTVNVSNVAKPTSTSAVTFKPNTGVTARISGAAASTQIFKILTSYVNIDGSNSGGTTRNLTIENTSTTTPQVIVIGSVGTTPITNCSVKNCNIINGVNSSSALIVSDGTTPGTAGWFNNITIQNNTIQKAYIANYNISVVAAGNGSGLTVTGNDLATAGANSFRLVGVYAQGIDGATVSNNTIGNVLNTTDASNITGIWFATGTSNSTISGNTITAMRGTSSGPRGVAVSTGVANANIQIINNTISNISDTATSPPYGIYLFSTTTGVTIERNKVSGLLNTHMGGYGARGIHINTGVAASNVTVKNNFVSDIKASGDFSTTYWGIGIGVEGATGGVNVYYNSVNLFGSLAGYASGSGTIHTAFGVLSSTAGPLDVRDNIFVNKFNNTNQTIDKSYAINSQAPNTAFANINFNDYLAGDSAGVLGYLGGDQATLAAWRTATGRDSNSISADPVFTDSTNLHIATSVASPVDSAATPIAGITTDIDGDTRNATRPDIGADEFTRVTLPPPVVSNVVRSTRVPAAGDTVRVTCTITDTLGITTANLIYNVNGTGTTIPLVRTSGTPTNGTYAATIPGSANANGNRIEYQIQANSSSGNSITTAIVGANSYFAGLSPLSSTGVRALNADRSLKYSGYYCRVTGTINSPNFTVLSGRISYMFQDAFGGMNVNKASTVLTLNLGDSVIVMGQLGQFRGTTQLTPDSVSHITVVATNRPVPVTLVSVNAFNANPEQYESRLIQMVNLNRIRPTPAWGNNASIPVYQNVLADSTLMFLDADTPVPSLPEPTYPVNVTGVAGQFTTSASVYNDGYEIIPRQASDFTSGGGLSGNYTVGAGGSFPTLDSAVARLNAIGVSGPVTFTLIDSVYDVGGGDMPVLQGDVAAEIDPADAVTNRAAAPRVRRQEQTDNVGQININGPIPGASATNRITIRPATGTRVRITGTAAATFNLNNASYITFDGIGLTGTTRMTVENTFSGGVAFALVGNSDNNILQNMTIRAPYATGIGVYADTASGAAPDSTQILSNAIPSAYFGVYVRGGTYVIRGTRIMNNTIGGATDSIGAVGIYNQQVNGSVIANNTIRNVKDAAAAGGNIAGIWVATKQLNVQAYNNVINGVMNRTGATGAVFAAGIYHFGTSGDTSRSRYYNNMIYGLDNPSSSASATVRGMYLSTAIADLAAYNSIYLTGTDVGTINTGALYMSSASVNLTVKNNIAINARTATGTGRAMGFYILATPTGLVTNYNDLYVPTQTGSHVAAIGTTNYTTLASWIATGRDSQSVSVTANFQAPDLHINPNFLTPLDGGGTPIAGITTDIDGQTRNATRPDIGADEFSVGFFDNFEAFTVGQRLACQDSINWTTWSLQPCSTVEDPLISSAFAFSGTKSVVIVQNNDLVKRLGSRTSGIYSISFKVYIPSSKAGYFNTLAGFTPNPYNWGLEAYFDSAASGNNGRLFAGQSTAIPFAYVHNAWQTVKVLINLDIDSARFFINNTMIRQWRWTAGASGGTSPLRLDGNDFFGATAWDQMYMDDYNFTPDSWGGVGVQQPHEIPASFALMQNYPNPFNPTTTIRYSLPEAAHVTLTIYNILGQKVAELMNDVKGAGFHNVVWNGRNDAGLQVATGVYVYRIVATPSNGGAPFTSLKKMVLLK